MFLSWFILSDHDLPQIITEGMLHARSVMNTHDPFMVYPVHYSTDHMREGALKMHAGTVMITHVPFTLMCVWQLSDQRYNVLKFSLPSLEMHKTLQKKTIDTHCEQQRRFCKLNGIAYVNSVANGPINPKLHMLAKSNLGLELLVSLRHC